MTKLLSQIYFHHTFVESKIFKNSFCVYLFGLETLAFLKQGFSFRYTAYFKPVLF